jgi:hypothetical protein
MNISLKVKDALDTLKTNRQKHVDEYAAQVQGWKKAMEEYGEDLKKWSNGMSEDVFNKEIAARPLEPQKPQSFVQYYDNLILMLENHSEKTIYVEEHDFNQIIKDEFGWKGTFLANSAMYNSL